MPQSHPEYETIFNAAEDAIFLYDVTDTNSGYEFELRRLNPPLEAISGLSSEDCRGASPRELLDDEQGAEVAANLRQCVDLRERISYEEVLEMPAGTIHWQTKLNPVIRDNEVVQIVGIARDITEQKARSEALRRMKKRLDLALEATDTGVWEWNMETDEVVWNDALERLVGIEPGTFEGTYEAHAEYLHPNAVPKVERAVADALEGDGTFDTEFRMIRDDGDTIWVLGRGELYTEDGPRRMIGTTTDITDRKENELALSRREILDLSVELELHSENLADVMPESVNESMHLSLNGMVSGPSECQLIYTTVQGITPKEVRETIDELAIATDARLLSTCGELSRYEVVVEPDSAAAIFHRFEGELQSIAIEEGKCKLVGEFPETVDPTAVTEAVQETYPDVELVSQSRIASPTYLRMLIQDQLTERQQTVLKMAYHTGYFEQPRNVTGEDLASRLGITRQTFNTHLRKAQAELFQELFEGTIDLRD